MTATAVEKLRALLTRLGPDDDLCVSVPAGTLRELLAERDALVREVGKLAVVAENLWTTGDDGRLYSAVLDLRHRYAGPVAELEMRDLETADAAIAECRGDGSET